MSSNRSWLGIFNIRRLVNLKPGMKLFAKEFCQILQSIAVEEPTLSPALSPYPLHLPELAHLSKERVWHRRRQSRPFHTIAK